ncbi:MAG TPA: hypothetical protein PLM71_10460 [Syntrophorhabdaceae bacterium]|nr:hypothetical protein [Syntrophorhabdaceae bacterium]
MITLDAKRTRIAFITNVNKPNVKMFMGRVMNMRTGFMKMLIIPRNKATQRADKKLLTVTPGR